jgi:hypothetical protein
MGLAVVFSFSFLLLFLSSHMEQFEAAIRTTLFQRMVSECEQQYHVAIKIVKQKRTAYMFVSAP